LEKIGHAPLLFFKPFLLAGNVSEPSVRFYSYFYLTGQILAFFDKTCPVRYCGKIYEAIFKDKNN